MCVHRQRPLHRRHQVYINAQVIPNPVEVSHVDDPALANRPPAFVLECHRVSHRILHRLARSLFLFGLGL